MKNLAEAFRLINNIVRIGVIADVDVEHARARVQTGENLTGWRPWISARAGTAQVWDPPTKGEQVVLISPCGDLAQSIILTGIYAGNAPDNSADHYRRAFPDGSVITYDHAAKKLDAQLTGTATIHVTGNATVTSDAEVTVDAKAVRLNDGAGVVTGDHICQMTGKPHADCSKTVFAGK